MKTKGKKRDDDLTEMRDAFKRHKERARGGGSSKNSWLKLEKGRNVVYFLRRLEGRKFYTEGWTHFRVGPNERTIRCMDEGHIDLDRGLPTSGTKCPLCKKFLREQARINSEYEKGDEDGRAEWGRAKEKWAPRHQYYSNVLVEDDDGDFAVKILAYGPQIWGQLMNYFIGEDTDVGDFTDPEGGSWLNLKKEEKGRNRRNVEYKVFAVEGPSIADAWDTIKDALHDLDAAVGKVMSADEIIAIMKGVDIDKDSDDDSSDGESRRHKKRNRDDDEDEDEDADEDADEDEDEDADEDEDDDDRPIRVKKSKLASKMGNRSRRG